MFLRKRKSLAHILIPHLSISDLHRGCYGPISMCMSLKRLLTAYICVQLHNVNRPWLALLYKFCSGIGFPLGSCFYIVLKEIGQHLQIMKYIRIIKQ